MLLDHAKIMPYYFYMCDMIPNAEHWRTSVAEAQELQYQAARVHAGVRHAARRLRRAVRRQALGPHAEGLRPRPRASRTGRRTTAPASRTTTPTHSRATTPTTTRSTRCRKRARPGGANTWRTASWSSCPPEVVIPKERRCLARLGFPVPCRRMTSRRGSPGGGPGSACRSSGARSRARPSSGLACASRSVIGFRPKSCSMNASTEENS